MELNIYTDIIEQFLFKKRNDPNKLELEECTENALSRKSFRYNNKKKRDINIPHFIFLNMNRPADAILRTISTGLVIKGEY
jgi:hypothetical protein